MSGDFDKNIQVDEPGGSAISYAQYYKFEVDFICAKYSEKQLFL